jgi:hypothetical protein
MLNPTTIPCRAHQRERGRFRGTGSPRGAPGPYMHRGVGELQGLHEQLGVGPDQGPPGGTSGAPGIPPHQRHQRGVPRAGRRRWGRVGSVSCKLALTPCGLQWGERRGLPLPHPPFGTPEGPLQAPVLSTEPPNYIIEVNFQQFTWRQDSISKKGYRYQHLPWRQGCTSESTSSSI